MSDMIEMNRYTPFFNDDEMTVGMSIDKDGSWVHITTAERLRRELDEREQAHAFMVEVNNELHGQLAEAREVARTWENEAERRSRRYEKCAGELTETRALLREAVDQRAGVITQGWERKVRAFLARPDSGDEAK